MKTRLLDGQNAHDLLIATELLKAGGTVAFPTETVYGLGARGLDDGAIAAIYAAKGRPPDNPVILHVGSLDEALPLWRNDEETEGCILRAQLLADVLWPGPLTIVSWKSGLVPDSATAGLPQVAVRVPSHALARVLLKAVGQPLAAPSANASGRPSPTTARDVLESLDGHIDAVLDGGPCDVGVESTVIDVTSITPVVLRPGAIDAATLREILGDVETRAAGLLTHSATPSPGMRHRHYAPLIDDVQLTDFVGLEAAWATDAAILARASTLATLGARGERLPGAITEALDDTPTGFARGLYSALYRLERSKPQRLCIERVPDDDEWRAVLDRVLRACA